MLMSVFIPFRSFFFCCLFLFNSTDRLFYGIMILMYLVLLSRFYRYLFLISSSFSFLLCFSFYFARIFIFFFLPFFPLSPCYFVKITILDVDVDIHVFLYSFILSFRLPYLVLFLFLRLGPLSFPFHYFNSTRHLDKITTLDLDSDLPIYFQSSFPFFFFFFNVLFSLSLSLFSSSKLI